MNETEVTRYIAESFEGVNPFEAAGDIYFFYDPDDDEQDRMFPFVTLITDDKHDQFSNLNRPGVFRLNIGVGKQTFLSLFGSKFTPTEDAADGSYDFTALDQLLPHPVYGNMYWLSILNPSDETFEAKVKPLIAEAYDIAVGKHDRRVARGNTSTTE